MLNIRKKYGNAGKFQQTEEAAILIDLGCWTKADAFATFPDVAGEGKNNQTLMSAAPCQKASQSQERQRGYRRFRNLADGKGTDGSWNSRCRMCWAQPPKVRPFK